MSLATQLIDVVRGLDYLHSSGVVHGNLKQVSGPPNCAPLSVFFMKRVKQNILVDTRGHARLSDIGFAKLAPTGASKFDWTQSGADGCRWAAPEIFQNGKLSKQSDVFTYGFLAVEVRPPNRYLASPLPTFARYSRENFYGRGLTQRE